MNPIVFPSTWIPQSAREMLLACFKRVTVLQPARELVPSDLHRLEKIGRLDIRLPDENPADMLPDLLKAYHVWADLHEGERPDFHRFAQLATTAPDDASTEWIRARIRDAEGDGANVQDTPGGEAPDKLLMARLFLAIAQEFDQQNESLTRDLDDIAAMESNMFLSLSPDEQPRSLIAAGKPLPMGFGPEGAMPERRLASWRRLYASCRETTAASTPLPLFVTDDSETLRLLLTPESAPEVVCRIVGIRPAGEESPFEAASVHRSIDEALRSAAGDGPLSSPAVFSFADQAPPAENTGTLTVYRIKGSPAAPDPFDREDIPETGENTLCSLVGHIGKNCTLDSPK